MGLTIVNVAYPLAPVGPDAVGGAEQILTAIDRGLVERGHRSIVIAAEGSWCAGTLVPIPRPAGPYGAWAKRFAQAAVRLALRHVLQRGDVDVVHFHGIDFDTYVPDGGPPMVATLHLPPEWYPMSAFSFGPRVQLVAVSRSQRRRCPSPERLELVPNGVPLERFTPTGERGDFLLALGRICPEKGFHLAIEAARGAGKRLIIAGQVFEYPEHQRYFREEILPRLDGLRTIIGPVSLEQKRELLARARCVLVPSLAPETSSLVAMEAQACGTPVVAFRVGALPEVIAPGRTGFLVASVDEMVEAISLAGELEPEDCRRHAEWRFSSERMVDRYVSVYAGLVRPAGRRRRLDLEIVGSLDGLARLAEPWSELLDRCPFATPFQSPEWLLPWCRRFAPSRTRAVVARRGAELVAVLPLFELDSNGKRALALAGEGISDYLDAVVDPMLGAAEVHRLLEAAAELGADELWLDELRPGSPLLAASNAAARPVEPASACPVLPLPRSVDELAGRFSPSLARDVRQSEQRARREGMSIERAGVDDVADAMARLFRLHAARWRVRGEDGVLADEAVRGFHLEAAPGFARRGWLRLYTLRLSGAPAAVLYGFARLKAAHFYLSGFDPAHARLGVGKLLVLQALREAVAEGRDEFHFLRGREPYKYRFGAVDRQNVRFCVRLGRAAAREGECQAASESGGPSAT